MNFGAGGAFLTKFVDMAIESVNNAYKTPFEVTKSTY